MIKRQLRRVLPYLVLAWLSITLLILPGYFPSSLIPHEVFAAASLISAMIAVVGFFSSQLSDKISAISRVHELASKEGIETVEVIPSSDVFGLLPSGRELNLALDITQLRPYYIKLVQELIFRRETNRVQVLLTGMSDHHVDDQKFDAERRFFMDLLRRVIQTRTVEIRSSEHRVPVNILFSRPNLVLFFGLGSQGQTLVRVALNPFFDTGDYYRSLYQKTWEGASPLDLDNHE